MNNKFTIEKIGTIDYGIDGWEDYYKVINRGDDAVSIEDIEEMFPATDSNFHGDTFNSQGRAVWKKYYEGICAIVTVDYSYDC
jgi:hypothetical protein